MTPNSVFEHVINSKHGWAVAAQFRDFVNGDSEGFNENALDHIKRTLKDIGTEDADAMVQRLEDFAVVE